MATTRTEVSQIVYKTSVENKSTREISNEMEIPIERVARCVRMNKYAIQKRAMEFVDSTLDMALKIIKNNISAALEVSAISPSKLTREELSFQRSIGMPAVEKALEVGGIVGSPKSQSGVTQNIFQQNNTNLSNNVKDFLKSMGDSLKVGDGEVIDVPGESNNPVEIEDIQE